MTSLRISILLPTPQASGGEGLEQQYCVLRAAELLYLWNALASCALPQRLTLLQGEPNFLIWAAIEDLFAS